MFFEAAGVKVTAGGVHRQRRPSGTVAERRRWHHQSDDDDGGGGGGNFGLAEQRRAQRGRRLGVSRRRGASAERRWDANGADAGADGAADRLADGGWLPCRAASCPPPTPRLPRRRGRHRSHPARLAVAPPRNHPGERDGQRRYDRRQYRRQFPVPARPVAVVHGGVNQRRQTAGDGHERVRHPSPNAVIRRYMLTVH